MARECPRSARTLLRNSVAFFIWGGIVLAQPPGGPINPPALPATTTSGNFGPTLSPPGGIPSLPAPNTSTWTAIGPASLTESGSSASGRITGIAVDPSNASNIYVTAAGGGVWQTTNGGSSWNPLTDIQATLSMGAIAIAPSNHQRIYAGTGESNVSIDSNYGLGILVSTDGGATWSLSTGPAGVFTSRRLTVAKISVNPSNEDIAYAAMSDYGENGLCCSNTGIYKTTDGGATWTNVTSANGKDATLPWTDVVVDPNSPSIIYAAHGDAFNNDTFNGVYRSTNSGSTWTLLSGAPSGSSTGRYALAVAPSASGNNHHVLYVAITVPLGNAGGGGLFEMLVSNNADATTPTFTNLTSTPNFGGSGLQGWYDWIIGVSPMAAGTVYCAGALNYNNNTHQVIVSTNANTSGATPTWTDITNVGGIQPHTDSHAIAFDSSSHMYIGNDGGIWKYTLSPSGWTNLNGNLNTIQFTGIGLHPTSTQTVIGGSQDNGTELTTGSMQWTSTDGGDGGYSQISQTNPLIVYSNHPIGSFGATAFLRKSTNGGDTFASITPTISNQGAFNFYSPIFVDPSNGNRIFLGGDAVYESTTAGSTWTTHASPSANAINSVAALPGGNVIYISTGGTLSNTNAQIWVSTTDGSAWTNRSLPVGGAVQEIDIDPNDTTGGTAVAVINQFNGANGQVYRTINFGTTWTNISGNLPVLPVWSAKIGTDAHKTIYVSTESQVYSSPSPYTTWAVLGSGLPNAQGVHLELNNTTEELALATHGRGAWFFSVTPPVAPPSITKSFGVASITLNGTTSLTFTISNPNTNTTLTGLAFTDTLPAGLVVATPNALTNTCGGTATATAGSGSVSLATGTLAASASCTVAVNVKGTTLGTKNNSVTITSTEGGTGNTSNASLSVVLATAPSITKSFGVASITLNGTTSLTFTISNLNTSTTLTGLAFTDTLPAGLVVATPNALTNTCGGTATATAGSGSVSLATGTLAASASCTVAVNVKGTTLGTKNNSVTITSTEGGTGNTSNASLSVVLATAPSITKSFGVASITLNGTTSLTFTISNLNASTTLTGLAFTDTLPAGLVVATPNALTNTCGGTATATAGSGSVSLATGTLAASASCTVAVNVQGTTLGTKNNSVTITSTEGGTGNTSNASLLVLTAPTIAKAFNPPSIVSGSTSAVTLTLANSNVGIPLTGGSLSDTLTNMSAAGGPVTGTCVGTTPNTLTAGATALSFSGITIPANGSCTVVFSVTSANVAINPNTASGVTTTQTPTAGGASNIANLTVTPAGTPPTVVSYSVVCGGSCVYNLVGSARAHLPWNATGIQVVFSAPITSGNVNSLTGVTATGFSGLGTATLTWSFSGIANSAGSLATALATTGPNAIQSAGGNLTGSNTSFSIKILEGDFNDDGVVNASDMALVTVARSSPYNIFADVNGDGVVDTSDVAVVRAQNGQSNP